MGSAASEFGIVVTECIENLAGGIIESDDGGSESAV